MKKQLTLSAIAFGLFFTISTFAGQVDEKLALEQRMWITSKLYSSIQLYFAHWEGVPGLDLDSAYKNYLKQVAATDDRKSFDLASFEFIANLQNGHSTFSDKWLRETHGQPLGFLLLPVEGKWVVHQSRVQGLVPGDVVLSVDNVLMDDFYSQKSRFLSGSNLAEKQKRLFYSSFLFPDSFVLTLENEKRIEIRRKEQTLPPVPTKVLEGKMLQPDVAYLRIPSFGKLEEERKAVEFVKAHVQSKTMIIDVRGNGGGSTPQELVRALMNRPYREINEGTPMPIAVFGAYQQVVQMNPAENFSERDLGALQALGSYARPMLVALGALRQPENPIYTGNLILLIDDFCASACEDFVLPFKSNGRAKIIGRATEGSTGQPYMFDFGNGITFRISSKRVYFPDGSQFEGVGIQPDIMIPLTIQDLRTNNDTALKKALELAQ